MTDTNELVDKALDKIGELAAEVDRAHQQELYWRDKTLEVIGIGEALLALLTAHKAHVETLRAAADKLDTLPPQCDYDAGYLDGLLHALEVLDELG